MLLRRPRIVRFCYRQMGRFLVDFDLGVEVYVEVVGFDVHGAQVEALEGEGVAGGVGGADEQGAEEIGGVDLHFGGEFFGEEGLEQKVELLVAGELFDVGVAESDGFAFGFGDEGDGGLGRDGDAEAGAAEAELGVGVDGDDDAGLGGGGGEVGDDGSGGIAEGDVGVVDVDGAALGGGAAEIVAVEFAVGAGLVEELVGEGALEGGGGDG